MEIKFAPKKLLDLFKGEEYENPFEGHITLKILPFSQRLAKAKELTLKMNEAGEVELDQKADGADQIAKMVALVKKQATEVKLKRKDGGFEIKDIETAEYDEDASNLIVAAGKTLLSGVKLGES